MMLSSFVSISKKASVTFVNPKRFCSVAKQSTSCTSSIVSPSLLTSQTSKLTSIGIQSLIIPSPESIQEIKNAIILFHGYGGDGKDISMLSMGWKRYLPNTIFICPNGHEPCSINPSGFQWFDLTKDDPKYILEQSLKAEKKLKQLLVRFMFQSFDDQMRSFF